MRDTSSCTLSHQHVPRASMLVVALIAPASYVSPLPSLAKRPAFPRTGTILLEAPPPPPSSLYEEYLQTRDGSKGASPATAPAPAPEPT